MNILTLLPNDLALANMNIPTIYDLKPAFQKLLNPVLVGLAAKGVTANQVTISATLLSIISGGCIFAFHTSSWPLFALPFVLFIRMALNAIDGLLARKFNMASPLGAVLNEMGDVVSDCALYLPFMCLPNVNAGLIVAINLLAVLGEMMGVVAIQIGAQRQYDGPLGKSDRAFAFGLLALILASCEIPSTWVSIYLSILVVLATWTIFNRAIKALNEIGCS
jgi:CDP-diacylglycerol---glycerol-3-phosphate 3-phosphatidyltransferase